MPIQTHQRMIEELEALFSRYGDVPRAVTVKADLLHLGVWFTEEALGFIDTLAKSDNGVHHKTYPMFSQDMQPMGDLGREIYTRIPYWLVVRGGPYNLDPVLVRIYLNRESPYQITAKEERLELSLSNNLVAYCQTTREPKYYRKRFSSGVPYWEVMSHGGHVTLMRACQFWGGKVECKFCDINVNYRQKKVSQDFAFKEALKPVDDIVTVAQEVEKDAVEEVGFPIDLLIFFTGGTITKTFHTKNEDQCFMEYIEALKWSGRRRYLTMQMVAKDKEMQKKYRAAGLDRADFNMEVWDERLFDWLVPGKKEYIGYQEWIERLLDSVDVFGPGNARPSYVCGVEMARPHGFDLVKDALKSSTDGLDFLMKRGIVPHLPIWYREPKSYLVANYNQPSVPLDFFVQIAANVYGMWKKYSLPIPHWLFGVPERRVMGAPQSVWEDIVYIREVPHYEERVDAMLKHGLREAVSVVC